MKQQKIYFVRHAESAMNGRYCGSIDAPLSRRGILQAKVCAKKFSKIDFDVCFVSDLKRTMQTSSYLLKGRDIPVLKCPDIREIRFGEWEGKDYKEISKKYPSLYKRWIQNPCKVQLPKGEPFASFCDRVEKFSNFLLQNSCPRILVVAHGGTISVLKMILLKRHLSEFWKWVPENTEISVISFSNLRDREKRVTVPKGTVTLFHGFRLTDKSVQVSPE